MDNSTLLEYKDYQNFESKGASSREIQRDSDSQSQIWTPQRLVDEVYFSLMNAKGQFCMLDGLTKEVRARDPKNHGRGVIRRLYEEQARYKMYRMPIFQPPPTFVIHLKHIDDKVKEVLTKEDRLTMDFILEQAAERIFEHVDRRNYLLSTKRHFKVKLER
jgi:hypothetical protein